MERSLKKIEPGSPRSHRPPGCLAARGFSMVNSILTRELFANKCTLEKKAAKLDLGDVLNSPSTFRVVLNGPLVSKNMLFMRGSYSAPDTSVNTIRLFVPSTILLSPMTTRSRGFNTWVFTKKDAVPVSTRRWS